MSIISALYAGVSGMSAMSKSLQVTSNNIANINTVGFKASRTEFSDLLSQAINTPGGKKQIGRGVRVAAVQGLFHQGAFENTPVVTDVALNGSGFFVLTDSQGEYYTRAGQFRIDKDGFLVNSLGMYVNGYSIDSAGQTSNTRSPINLSSVTTPPNRTGDGIAEGTGVFLSVNLDPIEAFPDTNGVVAFDPANPGGTSNFSNVVTVYDSLGGTHTVNLYYNKVADNQWEWRAFVDGSEITGGTPGTAQQTANGTLEFDANGALASQTTTASSFDFVGGAAQGQVIGFDFKGSTQLRNGSVTSLITQDGFPAGNLQAIDIDRDGVILGVFNNGQARRLAVLTVASFPSEQELFRSGDSLFVGTFRAGQPVFGTANTGNNGSVAASTLELSNVDLADEFVRLITTQRAFQANTKIVSIGDEMLETVIAMKR